MPQHFPNGLDLVGQVLDSVQAVQAEQLVEIAQELQAGMLQMEPEQVGIERDVPRERVAVTEVNWDAAGRRCWNCETRRCQSILHSSFLPEP